MGLVIAVTLLTLGMAGDGAPARILPVSDFEPSIASDGQVAFVSNRNGAFDLHVASADGRSIRHLTRSIGVEDTPAWSPDGRRIAFSREIAGNSDIWVVDRDGRGERLVAGGKQNEIHPFWSPDGQRLAFTRFTRNEGSDDGRLELFSIDLKGTNERRLGDGSEASYGSWSPDGSHLVFWRRIDADNADIVMADADGRNPRRLTSAPEFDGWPVWSPDGKSIAFARERADDVDIHLLDVATGADLVLVSAPGRNTGPKWGHDGSYLLYNHSANGLTGIYRAKMGNLPARAASAPLMDDHSR